MAKVKTYRCVNYRCRYIIRIAQDFPIWHPETPLSLKKLPVPAESLTYITGYRSELFCRYCKKTVDAKEDMICPRCTRGGIYEDEGGRSCPQCIFGKLSLTNQSAL